MKVTIEVPKWPNYHSHAFTSNMNVCKLELMDFEAVLLQFSWYMPLIGLFEIFTPLCGV